MASCRILLSVILIAGAFYGCKDRQFGESKSDVLRDQDHGKYYDVNDPFKKCYEEGEPGSKELLYLCTGDRPDRKEAHYCVEKYLVSADLKWNWRFRAAHPMPPYSVNPLRTIDEVNLVFEKPENADVNDRILFTEVKEGAEVDIYDLSDGTILRRPKKEGTFRRTLTLDRKSLDRKTAKGRYTLEFKEKGLFKKWYVTEDQTLTCQVPDPSRPRIPGSPPKTPTPGSEPPKTPTPGGCCSD